LKARCQQQSSKRALLFQFETSSDQSLTLYRFFLRTSVIPSNLKIKLPLPGSYKKNEGGGGVNYGISIFFLSAAVRRNLPSFSKFVLKLQVRYVPGLESVGGRLTFSQN